MAVDRERLTALAREAGAFVPDTLAMFRGVIADDRVPRRAKIEAGAALGYILSPLDRLTDWIPVVGQLDDVAVVAFAVRRLVGAAGEPVLREHWRGSARGFELLMGLAATGLRPRGIITALVTGGGVAAAARRARGIVDGEVVARREEPH